ncbi:MAG: SpoIIE family protein phosphatase [Chloroflexi bacterium]|nr:SpoIIE family protein phosphatase [Chloroflexota bacterium]
MSQRENIPPQPTLSDISLFKSLPADERSQLLKTYKTWDAPSGSLILEEGKPGDEFYVILHGRVEIIRALNSPEESILGMRAPGEFIGEIGLLNQGAPRTATARAVEDTRLLTITYADFNNLLEHHPHLAYELASVLGARLTEALNETIRNLHFKNEKLELAYNELKAAQEQIVEKKKLEHSLQVAREIQYSILPVDIPQMDGYDIGAMMTPAQAVGGDFFGVYPLDGDHMALIVGDVSDKGIPAAIFMAQTHALLRASIQSGVNPADILRQVNHLLVEMNAQNLFVTVIYGILEKTSGEFRYARAGHELPLVLDAKGKASFPSPGKGMSLGVMENPALEESALTIPPGGFLLLYSDDVTDGMDADGLHFNSEGLVNAVLQSNVNSSAQQTCQSVFDTLVVFQKGEPQFDDVTLLGVRRLR